MNVPLSEKIRDLICGTNPKVLTRSDAIVILLNIHNLVCEKGEIPEEKSYIYRDGDIILFRGDTEFTWPDNIEKNERLDARARFNNLFLDLIFNTIATHIYHARIDEVEGQLRLNVEVAFKCGPYPMSKNQGYYFLVADDDDWDEWGHLKFSVQVFREREEELNHPGVGYHEFVVIRRHQGNPEQFRWVVEKIKWALGPDAPSADTPVYRGEEF